VILNGARFESHGMGCDFRVLILFMVFGKPPNPDVSFSAM
jgi:hypothetical protein